MWHFWTSRVFSVFHFRRKRASPSASQIWRLWPKTLGWPRPKGRSPTSSSTFQDDTFTFLYKINSPLRGCLCVQYLHVSSYKINILLFILKWMLSYFPFMFWFIHSWVFIAGLRGVTCFTATLTQTSIAQKVFVRRRWPLISIMQFDFWTFGLIIGPLPSWGSNPPVTNRAEPPDLSLPADCCTLILEHLSRKSRNTASGVISEGTMRL